MEHRGKPPLINLETYEEVFESKMDLKTQTVLYSNQSFLLKKA